MTTASSRRSLLQRLLDGHHRRAEAACARRVAEALTTDDLWRWFIRRVPRIVNEYVRGGADDEITRKENVLAFRQARTTAWGARRIVPYLHTTVVGLELAVPFFAAPVGSLRTLWPWGDAVVASIMGEFGTAMTLSTLSGTRMEEVREATQGQCWFQLYLCGGPNVAQRGIERAKRAGFDALVITIDTSVAGNRADHARMKPMLAMGPFRGLNRRQTLEKLLLYVKLVPQMLPRLSWLLSYYADGGLMDFVNVVMEEIVQDEEVVCMPYADIGKQLGASTVVWDDLRWVKDLWGDKPMIVKGVHNAEDAKRAEDAGASGVIWSNHGGRQQDRVPPSLHIVAEEMPKMQGSKMDFMMDGGIRRGGDVLIALSYGLKAVGLGRVTASGLGAGGAAGVRRAYQIIQSELERAMTLVGVESVEEIRQNGEKIRRDNLILDNSHLKDIVF